MTEGIKPWRELPIERRGRAFVATLQVHADRTRVGHFLFELLMFGLKQALACVFGGALLAAIYLTHLLWPSHAPLARYDGLVIYAITLQAAMLIFRLEDLREAGAILLFHAVGTGMELFKTSTGSWGYPEPSLLRLGSVPLFSGFMYASVGSYLARVWRIQHLRFTEYPPVVANLAPRGRDLLQFLFRPLRLGFALGAFWRGGAGLQTNNGILSARPYGPQHALIARLWINSAIHLVC